MLVERHPDRCLLVSDRNSRSWITSGLSHHKVPAGCFPVIAPNCLGRSLQMLCFLPQESLEGWDSSALIRGSRQKKPSKGWMARSPAVLQNRLLWSLPTTPARSPARPCSPSSTSPQTGATLALSTTRLKGSGRHVCCSPHHHQYGVGHGPGSLWLWTTEQGKQPLPHPSHHYGTLPQSTICHSHKIQEDCSYQPSPSLSLWLLVKLENH